VRRAIEAPVTDIGSLLFPYETMCVHWLPPVSIRGVSLCYPFHPRSLSSLEPEDAVLDHY